jgi:hypothetical protein
MFRHETNEDDVSEHRISRGHHANANSIIRKPFNNKPIHNKDFVDDAAKTGNP